MANIFDMYHSRCCCLTRKFSNSLRSIFFLLSTTDLKNLMWNCNKNVWSNKIQLKLYVEPVKNGWRCCLQMKVFNPITVFMKSNLLAKLNVKCPFSRKSTISVYFEHFRLSNKVKQFSFAQSFFSFRDFLKLVHRPKYSRSLYQKQKIYDAAVHLFTGRCSLNALVCTFGIFFFTSRSTIFR